MKSIYKRLMKIKLEHYKIQRKKARARSWSENQDA
jgi:hypothetical protein